MRGLLFCLAVSVFGDPGKGERLVERGHKDGAEGGRLEGGHVDRAGGE